MRVRYARVRAGMFGVLLLAVISPAALSVDTLPEHDALALLEARSDLASLVPSAPEEHFSAGAADRAETINSQRLKSQREAYRSAMKALDRRQWNEFDSLRQTLDDYPLAIYLDHSRLTRRMTEVSANDAQAFLDRAHGTPLYTRFLSAYLHHTGKRRQWLDFLAVKPDPPNSTVLQCYYYRAQLQRGDVERAWEGASRLWVHGKSRPDQCDPLFERWLAAGKLTDDIVWARLLAAFEARERNLMRYVARQGSDALKPWSDRLQAVYQRPERMMTMDLPTDAQYSADIAVAGTRYLARYSPEKALASWNAMRQQLAFSDEQVRQAESELAKRSLFAKSEDNKPWLAGTLVQLSDDTLTGIALRWALERQDWADLLATLPALSGDEQQDSGWRYWRAVALSNTGKTEEAQPAFTALAQERNYHGFLAADRLGQAYQFNAEPLSPRQLGRLDELPGVHRIVELRYHSEFQLAHSEWYTLLQNAEDEGEREELAQLALERAWYRKGIEAASKARRWDALDVRFPLAYREVFDYHGGEQGVPSSELMAISRRESAFYPEAVSPVGARGLMQIMPATGKQVASRLNLSHRTSDLMDVEHNVRLGSAYYRQLLERFDGNRIFALSAYNAGPHRVDRWRNEPGQDLPVDAWVDTIPFKETRNYVQAVLTYNVVFRYRLGEDDYKLLSDTEQRARY